MILLGILFALVFGQSGFDIPTPDLPEMQASCDAQGGMFFQQRGGAWQCLVPQADEGQSCSTANDCTGYCIGGDMPDRGTCSRFPVGPGCTTFLNETGAEVSICVD